LDIFTSRRFFTNALLFFKPASHQIITMSSKIVIAGGTGFIGNYLAAEFKKAPLDSALENILQRG
jgi:hypothetical protein